MEVGGNFGVEHGDFRGEGGHEFLRRQHDVARAKVLFVDFGEGCVSGAVSIADKPAFYVGSASFWIKLWPILQR